MNKIVISWLIMAVVLIGGCGVDYNKIISKVVTTSPTKKIAAELTQGKKVEEVKNPNFKFPSDVDQKQVLKYFKLGDIYFAAALNSSASFYLELTKGFQVTFVGLLASTDGQNWQKFLQVKDKDFGVKNNPYYLWNEDDKLYLTIVDHLGAGSGEGNLKLVEAESGKNWQIKGCYYFGANYNDSKTSGDYFVFSKNLTKHRSQALQNCDNLVLALID